MTGTSLDGLDCALIEITGEGLAMRAQFIRGASSDLGELKLPLRALAEQVAATTGHIARLLRAFSLLHAAAVKELLGGEPCDFVCVHGQTVFHQPPVSWQAFEPAPMAHELGVPVVFNLRQADLAAGGQGAPITPIADWVLFGGSRDPMTVVNLGGFANYTQWQVQQGPDAPAGRTAFLPDIQGGDICVCNQLLDRLALDRLQRPYDQDGSAAASGTADETAVDALMTRLARQSAGGRSLGTGDELSGWIGGVSALPAAVALRSACEAIGRTIASRTVGIPVVLAGGGARNKCLVDAIRTHSRAQVMTTTSLGVPVEFREAACFAVLGALCQDRVPITLPRVTGLPPVTGAPVAGMWAFPA